jgi:hypothetical protein
LEALVYGLQKLVSPFLLPFVIFWGNCFLLGSLLGVCVYDMLPRGMALSFFVGSS